MDELPKIYYNPETGFLSADKLYHKLKDKYPKITKKQVQEYVDKQYTHQVNKTVKKAKKYSSIISPFPKNNYQMDIIVYNRYQYGNYKYILCMIDVYSRYAAARAMTSRSMDNIIKNVEDIFNEMGKPNNLNCDNEFNKKDFNELMKKYKVKVWYSDPNEINKNAIVERFNRTLTEIIQRWRTATGKYDWPSILHKIIKNYNNTIHKTTKDTPDNLFKHKATTRQTFVVIPNKLSLGDKVRIKKERKVFGKNDEIKYSKDIYIINEIKKNRYYLTNTSNGKNVDKSYKEYELKPVGEVQYLEKPNEENNEEKKQHIETQVKRKLKRKMNKEGVDVNEQAIQRSSRERKPQYKLISDKYGVIK